uniref:Serpentine Receptor, class Z n=1 Tax=Caenorhabditis tropicalis TaxID=1561998 RepID=A0A1I7TUJ3_9PELO
MRFAVQLFNGSSTHFTVSDTDYYGQRYALNLLKYVFILFVIALVIVFPFFVSVFRANRDRDRHTAVYPIMNHFFKITCFFYFLSSLSITTVILHIIFGDQSKSIIRHLFAPYFQVFFYAPMVIYNHVHFLLIFLLAIQRFHFFFFSPSEATQRRIERITVSGIKYLYIFLFFLHFIFFVWMASRRDMAKQQINVYTIYYFSISFIALASGIVYIPIIISIRKLAHLPSARVNSPQNYILYQTIFIALSKVGHLLTFLIGFFGVPSMVRFLIISSFFDIVSTPVLIQISYLFCNKRNIQTLFSPFKLKSFISRGGTNVSPEAMTTIT